MKTGQKRAGDGLSWSQCAECTKPIRFFEKCFQNLDHPYRPSGGNEKNELPERVLIPNPQRKKKSKQSINFYEYYLYPPTLHARQKITKYHYVSDAASGYFRKTRKAAENLESAVNWQQYMSIAKAAQGRTQSTQNFQNVLYCFSGHWEQHDLSIDEGSLKKVMRSLP